MMQSRFCIFMKPMSFYDTFNVGGSRLLDKLHYVLVNLSNFNIYMYIDCFNYLHIQFTNPNFTQTNTLPKATYGLNILLTYSHIHFLQKQIQGTFRHFTEKKMTTLKLTRACKLFTKLISIVG